MAGPGQRCFYLAGMSHRIRPDDMRYISDQLIQINRAPDSIASLNRVAHVLDDLVGTMRVRCHVDQDLAQRLGSSLALSISRIPAFALVMMAESGWLSSCASEAVISPSKLTRLSRLICSR